MRMLIVLAAMTLATPALAELNDPVTQARRAAIAATQTYKVVEYPHIWSWGVIRYTSHPASFERSAIMGMYKTKGEAEDAANALRSK